MPLTALDLKEFCFYEFSKYEFQQLMILGDVL